MSLSIDDIVVGHTYVLRRPFISFIGVSSEVWPRGTPVTIVSAQGTWPHGWVVARCFGDTLGVPTTALMSLEEWAPHALAT